MKLTKPTLLLDEQKCRANISKMTRKARKHVVDLQPHFKTHQSWVVGDWYREAGVKSITVSSLEMASYFADDKWEEITVAFPINVLRIDTINNLAAKLRLNVYVNNLEAAHYLSKHLQHAVGVFTELDTGYHRSGIPFQNYDEIEQLLKFFNQSEYLDFQGFYAHAGHTYHAEDSRRINEIQKVTVERLSEVRNGFSDYSIKITIGDTPGCSLSDDFEKVDIIRPGNFVFYDLVQANIGACTSEDIAVCMACPVVEKRPERGEVIIHGGAIHFSKDALTTKEGLSYGQLVSLHNSGWGAPLDGCYVKSISQEHGLVVLSDEVFAKTKVGDWVGVLPVHSCLTANLMGSYTTPQGRVISMM